MYLNDNLDQVIKKLINQALENVPNFDSDEWKTFVQTWLCTDNCDKGNWRSVGENYYQSLLQLSALSDDGNFTWAHSQDPHSRHSKYERNSYMWA